jgi:gamma-glutamylputrescine oxidase
MTKPESVAAANVPVWDDGAGVALPRLEGTVEADVCVVGLGGSGLACVGELLALGQRVVALDAVTIGAGAAGRNGGFLLAGTARFHHDAAAVLGKERAREAYRATVDEIARIADETPDAVRRVGSLRIAASDREAEDCRAHLDALRGDGFSAEWYEGPEGRGILIPTDCAFDPLARCRALARRALDAGARLFERSAAVEMAGDEVRTADGVVRCGRTIVAVDGALEGLFPELAGRVRTARLQMLATAPLPEIRWPRPVYMRWGYEWWQQLADGRVALGGFRDHGGEAEWTADATPAQPVQGLIEAFLRGPLGVDAPVTHRWAASVGYTPDAVPVLEEVRPGLWAAGGYSGTGNVVGALFGRAAAQLAVRGRSDLAAPLRASA